jgi:hypothetical protein
MDVKITVRNGLECPNCGAPELVPHTANPDGSYKDENTRWAIRPFKVDDWSQCLCCAGILDRQTFEPTGKTNADPEVHKKGWFQL